MTKQIELISHEGNKQTTETMTIKPMGILQIAQVSKEINALIKDVKANEHLQDAINEYMKASKEAGDYNKALLTSGLKEGREVLESEYQTNMDVLKGVSGNFIENILGSFEIILENAPERLVNLISVASGINNSQLVAEQDPYTFLDLFDAIVEVNDIPRLMERLKKSSNSLKTLMQATTTTKE